MTNIFVEFMPTPSLREITLELLKKLPDTASEEEIMYQIHLAAQVVEGLHDVSEKKTLTTDELLQRVALWQK